MTSLTEQLNSLCGQLYVKTFNIPDTDYNRLAGWHLIRDYTAVCLRPAFNGPPVLLQMWPILVGWEGLGKTTFGRVLSGASPTRPAPRYTDKVVFTDFKPSADHGDINLYRKICGKTVCELADKTLAAGRDLSDTLKSSVNRGYLEYTPKYGRGATHARYNVRCVYLVTTNNSDILTADMGERRWPIIDLNRSEWTKEDLPDGRNPGLDWFHKYRPRMLAEMHDSGAWKGDMHPTPDFLELMKSAQKDFMAEENWQIMLAARLRSEPFSLDNGSYVLSSHLATYMRDEHGNAAPRPSAYGPYLRTLGWNSCVVWRDGSTRIWCRVPPPDITFEVGWVSEGRKFAVAEADKSMGDRIRKANGGSLPSDEDVPF